MRRSARLLEVQLEGQAANEIGTRSRGTPRIANRLLKRVRDFAHATKSEEITAAIAQQGLERLHVDHAGLDEMDRGILRLIIEKFSGGPVGIDTIAAAIGEERDTLEDVYEPYLLQSGFLARTKRGREVTLSAYDHLGLSPEKAMNENLEIFS